MAIHEIAPSDWQRFLTDFGRGHRAWLTTVERIRNGATHVEVRNRSLGRISAEVTNQRVVGIAIEFQADGAKEALVRVEAPVKLRVDENKEGRARALEIEDAHGGRTRLSFRAAPPLEALDGLAPAEVPTSSQKTTG